MIHIFVTLFQFVFAATSPVVTPALVPVATYAKLTCAGVVTIPGQPQVYQDLMDMYFNVAMTSPYPTLVELRKQSPERFDFMIKECNRLRYANSTLPTPPPSVWPDWGNDRKYQKFKLGHSFIYSTQCRAVKAACHLASNCCSGNCDLNLGQCK